MVTAPGCPDRRVATKAGRSPPAPFLRSGFGGGVTGTVDVVPVRPMFPLESVLVPGMVLPLHVFEERYRILVLDSLAADQEFGVVLIERGSEVGGEDVRSMVGTIAEIAQAQQLDDGRWAVIAVGTRRIRVLRWLEDAPYPQAEIEDWPDAPPVDGDELAEAYRSQVSVLRRVLAMTVELGFPATPTVELAEDPVAGSYHLSVLAPLGPLDRQRLLAADGPSERLHLVGALLAEEASDLEAQLGGA